MTGVKLEFFLPKLKEIRLISSLPSFASAVVNRYRAIYQKRGSSKRKKISSCYIEQKLGRKPVAKPVLYYNHKFLPFNLGVIFKLDKDSLHESLRLSRDDLTVKQTDVIHANAYGTAFLVDGCHFWMVNIDSFKGENAFIAVGK